MGPSFAAKAFKELYDDKADRYEVILYGSLAATGKGHMTDVAIENELKPKKVTFIWKANETLTFHVNGMTLKAFQNDKEVGQETYYSVGGGAIITDSELDKIEASLGGIQKLLSVMYACLEIFQSVTSQIYTRVSHGSVTSHENCLVPAESAMPRVDIKKVF